MGYKHVYLDIAATDLIAAIKVVQAVGQAVQLPNDSYILFHDMNLLNEWIGIYPDSPTPDTLKDLEYDSFSHLIVQHNKLQPSIVSILDNMPRIPNSDYMQSIDDHPGNGTANYNTLAAHDEDYSHAPSSPLSLLGGIPHTVQQNVFNFWMVFLKEIEDIRSTFHNIYNMGRNCTILAILEEHIDKKFDGGISYRVAVSKETNKNLIELSCEYGSPYSSVEHYIVACAPDLEDFTFSVAKDAELDMDIMCKISHASSTMQISEEVILSAEFNIMRGKFNKVNITIDLETFYNALDPNSGPRAFELCQLLLGTPFVSHWVERVDFVKTPTEKIKLQKEERNFFNVKQLLSKLKDSLKGVECFQMQGPLHQEDLCYYQAFKIENPRLVPCYDYPAMQDLQYCRIAHKAVATSNILEALCSPRSGFYSPRFSQNDETFLYLKSTIIPQPGQDIKTEAGVIADKLSEFLCPTDGVVLFGHGIGIKYLYFLIATTNTSIAIRNLRIFGQKIGMSKRSWILYADQEMHANWISIYDDSPIPPMLKIIV